jgi:hypothetical protein
MHPATSDACTASDHVATAATAPHNIGEKRKGEVLNRKFN